MTHQFQPTPFTCVHTCLAMVLDRPVEEVIQEVGLPQGMYQRDLLDALERYEIEHLPTMFSKLWWGWNLLAVPSLNVRGGAHQILLHFDGKNYQVMDPSPRTRYKEDGSDLMTWFDVILVKPMAP